MLSDNLAFTVGVNRIRQRGTFEFYRSEYAGQPARADPARLGAQEDILYAQIDLDEVPEERRKALHWTLRRPELYKTSVSRKGRGMMENLDLF